MHITVLVCTSICFCIVILRSSWWWWLGEMCIKSVIHVRIPLIFTLSVLTFGWQMQHAWLSRASVGDGLCPLTKNLLQVFVKCHLGCALIMSLSFLVLLQQISPFVRAHCSGAIISMLFHFTRDLLPQMLVAFRCVEQTFHLLAICYQHFDLILNPCFSPLFGCLGVLVLTIPNK